MRFVPLQRNHWEWIHERTGLIYVGDVRGLAVESGGKILGVCACDTWTATSVQIHIAIDSPVALKNHQLLKESFNYIFNKAGREVAIGLVAADNEKALKFDKKIGFIEQCRIRDGHDKGIDMVILTLHKTDCRWLNGR